MREYAVRRGRILQHIVGSLFRTPVVLPLALSLTLSWSLWMPNQPTPHLTVPVRLRSPELPVLQGGLIRMFARPTSMTKRITTRAYCCGSLAMMTDRCRAGTAKNCMPRVTRAPYYTLVEVLSIISAGNDSHYNPIFITFHDRPITLDCSGALFGSKRSAFGVIVLFLLLFCFYQPTNRH